MGLHKLLNLNQHSYGDNLQSLRSLRSDAYDSLQRVLRIADQVIQPEPVKSDSQKRQCALRPSSRWPKRDPRSTIPSQDTD